MRIPMKDEIIKRSKTKENLGAGFSSSQTRTELKISLKKAREDAKNYHKKTINDINPQNI